MQIKSFTTWMQSGVDKQRASEVNYVFLRRMWIEWMRLRWGPLSHLLMYLVPSYRLVKAGILGPRATLSIILDIDIRSIPGDLLHGDWRSCLQHIEKNRNRNRNKKKRT